MHQCPDHGKTAGQVMQVCVSHVRYLQDSRLSHRRQNRYLLRSKLEPARVSVCTLEVCTLEVYQTAGYDCACFDPAATSLLREERAIRCGGVTICSGASHREHQHED